MTSAGSRCFSIPILALLGMNDGPLISIEMRPRTGSMAACVMLSKAMICDFFKTGNGSMAGLFMKDKGRLLCNLARLGDIE